MRIYPLKQLISPFWRWALFLVLLPILELFLLLSFAGIWLTLLSILICGLVGILIAYREGLRHWTQLNQHLDRGEAPTVHALHGVLVLLATVFMVLPGLLTSLFGLFLLFPLTRSLVVSYLILRFEAYRLQTRKENTPRAPEIIDV